MPPHAVITPPMSRTASAPIDGAPAGFGAQPLEGGADPASAPALVVFNWNINSIRARFDLLATLLRRVRPDVLLLQETRCHDGQFPLTPLRRRGFRHVALNGRGGHHGVAILSKRPLRDVRIDVIGGVDEARHVSAIIDCPEPVRLHSLYVPSGGDEPDPETNAKFRAKLDFVAGMAPWGRAATGEAALVAGDFNVAPLQSDVWSHRQLLDVISHTPAETDGLQRALEAGRWVDVVRRDRPEPEPIFTWWSYRNKTWPGSNRGRRLDHVWASPQIADRVSATIMTDARGLPKASDHVPLVISVGAAVQPAPLAPARTEGQ